MLFLAQGYTNPGHQVVSVTKFCTVALNISLSSVWNLICVTLLAPRMFRWLLNFFENLCTLAIANILIHVPSKKYL
jgi:hypothetical protein